MREGGREEGREGRGGREHLRGIAEIDGECLHTGVREAPFLSQTTHAHNKIGSQGKES
jgi:hypothetical protein